VRIFIIDEDETTVKGLSWFLSKQGHRTGSASDVLAAYERMEKETPEAILWDCRLIRMGDIDLLATMRSRFPHAPIVVMLDPPEAEHTASILGRGVYDCMTKPIQLRELERILGQIRQNRILASPIH
jgi:DNA-binding response OmpR family regulator